MNPEEIEQMNALEQVRELSYYNLQGVGDQHDSDMVNWHIEMTLKVSTLKQTRGIVTGRTKRTSAPPQWHTKLAVARS
jgi:hypothetical protein